MHTALQFVAGTVMLVGAGYCITRPRGAFTFMMGILMSITALVLMFGSIYKSAAAQYSAPYAIPYRPL